MPSTLVAVQLPAAPPAIEKTPPPVAEPPGPASSVPRPLMKMVDPSGAIAVSPATTQTYASWLPWASAAIAGAVVRAIAAREMPNTAKIFTQHLPSTTKGLIRRVDEQPPLNGRYSATAKVTNRPASGQEPSDPPPSNCTNETGCCRSHWLSSWLSQGSV